MKKENFVSDVKEAINVALFKHNVMHSVAGDKHKNKSALLILIIAALLSGVGVHYFGGFFSPSFGMTLGMMINQFAFTIIGIYVLSLIAQKLFKGKAAHDAFFRVMAFALIVSWLTVIPMLSFISALWGLALVFVILKVVHKLSSGGAVGAILVSLVAFAIIGAILGSILSSLGLGTYGIGSYGRGVIKGGDFGDYYKDGFKMNFKGDEGESSMEMEGGVMKIKGPDGETMEIEIPSFE